MERVIVSSKKGEQYLHCSDCYDVLGVITSGEFDLHDVGWPCGNCGRLNKSSDDGQEEIKDKNGAKHIIFTHTTEGVNRIKALARPGFSFKRIVSSRDLDVDLSSFGQHNTRK